MAVVEYFKVTGPDGEPLHGGSGPWPLPHRVHVPGRTELGWRAGRWRTVEGEIRACHNGLHLALRQHVDMWMPGRYEDYIVWRAEGRGDVDDHSSGKLAFREARLLRPALVVDREFVARWESRLGDHRPTITASAVPDPLTNRWAFDALMAWEGAGRPVADPAPPRLVFGVHHLANDKDARAPGWPASGTLSYRLYQRTLRKMDRILRDAAKRQAQATS